jgi:hypothetical protein
MGKGIIESCVLLILAMALLPLLLLIDMAIIVLSFGTVLFCVKNYQPIGITLFSQLLG